MYGQTPTALAQFANDTKLSALRSGYVMLPAAPRAGDVIVARLTRSSVGLLIATSSTSHCLYAPCPTMWEALQRARQVAASLSVDVWHHTSEKTLECIASYRKGETRADES